MSHPSQRGPHAAGHVPLQRDLAQTLTHDRLRDADSYRLRREARSRQADARETPSLLARLVRLTGAAVKTPVTLVRRARPRPAMTASAVAQLDEHRGSGPR